MTTAAAPTPACRRRSPASTAVRPEGSQTFESSSSFRRTIAPPPPTENRRTRYDVRPARANDVGRQPSGRRLGRMPIPSFTTPPGGSTAPPLELLDLAAQYVVARSVAVAAKLRLADHLVDRPRSADELAGLCGAHPRSLYRMLRLLAAAGIFVKTGDDRFSLTPLGDCLRTDHPVSMGSFFRMVDGPIGRVAFEIGHTVRTGEPADRLVLGAELFEYLAKHPEDSADFDEAMTDLRKQFTGPILMAYDFSQFTTIVDVAGGQGFFLQCLLAGNPTVKGVLFDQPHVVEAGRAAMAEAGLAERCEVVGGDFFESVPPGADGYCLSW